MSFAKLRELMVEPYDQEKDAEYIDAIESIENEEERMLACEYFVQHGFLIETWQTKMTKLPIFANIELSNNNISSLEGVEFPKNLQRLYLDGNNISSLDGVQWPQSLQRLFLNGNNISSLDGVKWPEKLKHLKLNRNQLNSLEGVKWPKNMKSLCLRNNNLSQEQKELVRREARWAYIEI